ncbi:MAG: glycosyltransferase [Candidatus Omnitrophota bacterium]
MKKRILFIHSNLDIGGAQKMRLTLLQSLDRNEYDIRILCLERKGQLGEQAEQRGFIVDVLNQSDRLYNFLTTFKLFRYLKRNQFLIVQSSLFRANFHSRIAAKLAGVPVIIAEEHGEHYQFKRLKLFPYALIDRILSFFTDRIICCAQQMRLSLAKIEGIPAQKITVILNAVMEESLALKKSKGVVRQELGINGHSAVIGTIGVLSKAKAQAVLLRAFSEVLKVIPESTLVIVGDGPLRPKLKKYAQDLKIDHRVIFTGERRDVADLLNIMDVFVLSSESEGLPITLLEAMYLGVPCVVSKVGGIPEIIEDGKTGYLFSFPDFKDLADKIKTLLNHPDLARKLTLAAQGEVKENFLSMQYANKLAKLHRDLLISKKLDQYV